MSTHFKSDFPPTIYYNNINYIYIYNDFITKHFKYIANLKKEFYSEKHKSTT